MRSFISPLLLGVSMLTAFTSAATLGEPCLAEICGEKGFAASPQPTAIHPALGDRDLTNGERLSLGLPPRAPSRRYRVDVREPQASPTPKSTTTGTIQVKRASDGVVLGTLDQNTLAQGNFKYTNDPGTALKVQVSLDVGKTSGSGLAITMLNAAGPLLGYVQGRDNANSNIGPGSFQYLYLNGVSLPGSPAGSIPTTMSSVYSTAAGTARTAETNIWSINLVTGEMSAQWINSDGSSPATVAFSQSGYMYGGGDPAAFQSRYPSPTTPLTLVFVPDAAPAGANLPI